MMLTLEEFTSILGDSFFNGDSAIAGMVVFSAVMLLLFGLFGKRSILVPFALMLPVTLVFTTLKIIPESLTILLVIVSVMGLAYAAKDKF